MTHAPETVYQFMARLVGSLANARRLEIVELLKDRERRVSELAATLGLPQATTSQHLAILRRAGIVETRKAGNAVYYRLAIPTLVQACDAMARASRDLLVRQQDLLRPILAAVRRPMDKG